MEPNQWLRDCLQKSRLVYFSVCVRVHARACFCMYFPFFFYHNALQTLENDIYFSNGHNCYAISEDPQFTTPFHVEYEENQV